VKAYAAPVGVNTANVMTMWTDLPAVRYFRPEQQVAFYQRLKAPGTSHAKFIANQINEIGRKFANARFAFAFFGFGCIILAARWK
jgi:hypothetical protein